MTSNTEAKIRKIFDIEKSELKKNAETAHYMVILSLVPIKDRTTENSFATVPYRRSRKSPWIS